MIPEFDDHGNLPVGIHEATVKEVIELERFRGPSMLRKQLLEPLQDFYELVRPAAIEIYLVGSFITEKPDPGDVDFFVIMPSGWVQQYRRVAQEIFELQQRRRLGHHTLIHCLICEDGTPLCQYYFDLFSTTKDENGERPKGMIRLIGGTHDQE